MQHAETGSHVDALRALFRQFADTECRTEPLYDAIARITADDDELLQLLEAAPPLQRRPVLLLAAIHDLILGGAEHGLRDYFRSVGGQREPDAALAPALREFCARYREQLLGRIASRTTQTNEVGRCAVLLPALVAIAADARAPLALLDVGCSAGLNLNFDRYTYDYGACRVGDAASRVRIESALLGLHAPPCPERFPAIHDRCGMDLDPIAADDDAAIRWLRACIWPHDRLRAERFGHAIAVLHRYPVPLRRIADPVTALREWVAQVPADVAPVVINTWTLTYFPRELRTRYSAMLDELVRSRGLYWLSGEMPQLLIGDATPPSLPADADIERRNGTLWTLCRRKDSRAVYEVVARSHPHGRWLEWFGLSRRNPVDPPA